MIKLYHTRIQDQPMAVDCLPYLKESERRRLEAASPLTAKRRWALLYMIQNLCQETGLPLSVLSCLWHSADGKPYLGPYYMSVSYSGAFAFCAFSKENIGIMRGEIKKDLSDERNWYLQWNGQIGM